jgi:hypothetical protein
MCNDQNDFPDSCIILLFRYLRPEWISSPKKGKKGHATLLEGYAFYFSDQKPAMDHRDHHENQQ